MGLSRARDIPAEQRSDKSSSGLLSVPSPVQRLLKTVVATQMLFALQSLCTQRPCWAFHLGWKVWPGREQARGTAAVTAMCSVGMQRRLFIPDTAQGLGTVSLNLLDMQETLCWQRELPTGKLLPAGV